MRSYYMETDEQVELILQMKNKYEIDTFVETGTAAGETPWLLRNEFKYIYTVELDNAFYLAAVNRFANYPQIKVFHGESNLVLEGLVPQLNRPTIYWLDAHWVGGDSIKGRWGATPILEELKHILDARRKNGSVVLIDDARLFGTTDGYPSVKEVEAIAHASGYGFYLDQDAFVLIDDEL